MIGPCTLLLIPTLKISDRTSLEYVGLLRHERLEFTIGLSMPWESCLSFPLNFLCSGNEKHDECDCTLRLLYPMAEEASN